MNIEKITGWNQISNYLYKKYPDYRAEEKYKDLLDYFKIRADLIESKSPIEIYTKAFEDTIKYFKRNENLK